MSKSKSDFNSLKKPEYHLSKMLLMNILVMWIKGYPFRAYI